MKTNLRHVPRFAGPFWCFNGHAYTIGRSLIGDTNPPEIEHREIATPDDDFLELDCAIRENSKAVVALFHGLEGSSRRYYIIEIMKRLISKGYSVVAVNFRSCGSKMNNQQRFYHSGETDDLRTVFQWIAHNYPDQKIGAVGFSLGANALSKYLGEEKENSPLDAAVAVSVPYDLRLGAIILSNGFHRVYDRYFLRNLRDKLKKKRSRFPDLPKFTGSTIYEFDNQVTAPIHGFKDADDYYSKCSARRFVQDIRTHTLFIHSREDPLCPIKVMPLAKMNNNQFTDYIVTDEGGHVGFWSKPRGWLNFVIENYLSSNI